MAHTEERTKRAVPQFALKDKLRHITGVEGWVVDVATQQQVPVQIAPSPQHPQGGQGVQIRNLERAVYVLAYVDKNGCVQILKTDEQFAEKM